MDRSCTPVIGSGVAGEGILPTRECLAETWADRWLMPIAGQNRIDLAKVAQYLSVRLAAADQPRTEVRLHLRDTLVDRYRPMLSLEHGDQLPHMAVGKLISTVGKSHRQKAPLEDPYAVLASLRLPIYITTSWTALLEDAIEESLGHAPAIGYFDWHEKTYSGGAVSDPTPENPLVYHLFGNIDDPSSLVLSEDDYFTWMAEWNKRVDKDESIPDAVRIALTDRSLLFLGYGLDDWEFKVLFQGIKSFGGNRLHRKLHVGVQVSPESGMIEPESAQDYLEKYFGEPPRVNVYWGTCQAFLTELSRRIRMRHG